MVLLLYNKVDASWVIEYYDLTEDDPRLILKERGNGNGKRNA
jgi:hypothetical protein